MRTKSEIIEKKSHDQQSLDLSTTDPKNHRRYQRLFLLGAIFLTIGLSLSFIIYRQLKIFLAHPQIKLPTLPALSTRLRTPSASLDDNLTLTIDHLLGSSTVAWNVVVSDHLYLYNWNRNFATESAQFVTSQIDQLIAAPAATIISQHLPEGLRVQEKFTSTDSLQHLFALISLPGKTVYLSFQSRSSVDQFKSTLSVLAPAIYWTIIQNPL